MTAGEALEPSTRPDPARLVGCILTLNEEATIARAVDSMARAADVVLVVDSHSTDRTREIAADHGAIVVEHAFESYSAQRNWALAHVTEGWGAGTWVFMLDADEWLSDELARELVTVTTTPAGSGAADVYNVAVRRRFDGRVLRFGGFGRTWILRLVRAGQLEYNDREANETFDVPTTARVGQLDGWLEHDDVRSWEHYIAKHNQYSTMEARARVEVGRANQRQVTLREAVRDPSQRRRFLRQQIWDRVPSAVRPPLRFIQIYVVFAGFLDGRSGFERALFEAWQEMCIDLKANQLTNRPDEVPR